MRKRRNGHGAGGGKCCATMSTDPYLSFRRKVCITLAGICLIFSIGCSGPSMKISLHGDNAVIDVQTLGEYPTTVSKAKLSNKTTRQTIWEIETDSATPQIHQIVFRLGANPARMVYPTAGSYRVVIPASQASFRIEPNTEYIIQIWGEPGLSHADGVFVLTAK